MKSEKESYIEAVRSEKERLRGETLGQLAAAMRGERSLDGRPIPEQIASVGKALGCMLEQLAQKRALGALKASRQVKGA